MSRPITPTPINPDYAEDRTWRVELFTEYNTPYPITVHRERIQTNSDGDLLMDPIREDIDPTTTDGGKPDSFSLELPDLQGTVGLGRDITVPASPYGEEVTFKLSKIAEIIIAAIESVADDNCENRKLYQQLLNEEITQEQYDNAVALLIKTSPIN